MSITLEVHDKIVVPSGIDIEWTRKHLIDGVGQGATLTGTKGVHHESN